MIEEQFVSFDTAKLLKEAGFDAPCERYYSWFKGKPVRCNCNGKLNHNRDKSEDADISRPTQALAARWLREAHEIDVVVSIYGREFYMCNVYKKRRMVITSIESSFEEALEVGLREAIKLIKK